jgi:hypothetical protein
METPGLIIFTISPSGIESNQTSENPTTAIVNLEEPSGDNTPYPDIPLPKTVTHLTINGADFLDQGCAPHVIENSAGITHLTLVGYSKPTSVELYSLGVHLGSSTHNYESSPACFSEWKFPNVEVLIFSRGKVDIDTDFDQFPRLDLIEFHDCDVCPTTRIRDIHVNTFKSRICQCPHDVDPDQQETAHRIKTNIGLSLE